jgi:hypothetical protein
LGAFRFCNYHCIMISEKMQKRIGWTMSILLSIMFLLSAMMKVTGNQEAVQHAVDMGFDAMTYQALGYVELLAIALFLIPRTGVVGVMLLMIYMGGAICVHLVSHQPLVPVIAFEVLLWITAAVRFPELRQRLFNS